MPKSSSLDILRQTATDLIQAIQKPTPATPFNPLDDTTRHALTQLADIFNNTITPNKSEASSIPTSTKHNTPAPRVETKPCQTQQPTYTQPLRHSPRLNQHASNISSVISPLELTAMTHRCHHVATIRSSDPILLEPDLQIPNLFLQANSVVCPDTGKDLEYRQLLQHPNPTVQAAWQLSSANEFGRLAQGIGTRIQGTNTIFFIPKSKIPSTNYATYARFVCTYRPNKSEPNRTRLTVGGNLIQYPGDVSTRTADLTPAKIHLNSTISDPHAKYMCMDIRNFYLGTPLPNFEYIRFRLSDIPIEVQTQYKLQDITSNGWVYAEIHKVCMDYHNPASLPTNFCEND